MGKRNLNMQNKGKCSWPNVALIGKRGYVLPNVINGGIGGITGLAAIFPLDLVKTRLQKQRIGPDGKALYKNMFDAFIKTYKAEGFFGMYRGILVTSILVTPEKAIKLPANEFFRQYFTRDDGILTIPFQVLSGALAGICQCVVTTPMELLKIQMQDAGRIAAQAKQAGKTVKKESFPELVVGIYKASGIRGFYKGTFPTLIRDVHFSMLYFPLFATINDKGPKRAEGEAVFWWSLMAGFISGAVAAFLVTPLDVIKTRIQTITKGEGDRVYSGLINTGLVVFKEEGVTALFKGALCRVMVVAPMFGITQAVFYLGAAEYLLGHKKST